MSKYTKYLEKFKKIDENDRQSSTKGISGKLHKNNQILEEIMEKERKVVDKKSSNVVKREEKLIKTIQKQKLLLSKLSKDKRQLKEHVNLLGENLHLLQTEVSEIRNNMEREIENQKIIWHKVEKAKRAKWMESERKSLKLQTLKAFEPELQKLLRKHKVGKQKMMEKFEKGLTMQEKELQKQHKLIVTQLKEKFRVDKESTVKSEKEKYYSKIQAFKDEYEKLKAQLQEEMEMRFSKEKERIREREKSVYENALSENKRAFETEKKNMAENYMAKQKIEKDKFELSKRRIEIENEKILAGFRREIAGQMKKELEEQVKVIITKSQKEILDEKRKVQSQKDKEVDVLVEKERGKFEDEMTRLHRRVYELETHNEELLRAISEERKKARDLVLQNENLGLENEKKTQKMRFVRDEKTGWTLKVEKMKQSLLAEKRDKVVMKEKIENLEREKSELVHKQKSEMGDLMHKIKEMIAKKDGTIDNLAKKVKTLQSTLQSTNVMIQRQKMEMLRK